MTKLSEINNGGLRSVTRREYLCNMPEAHRESAVALLSMSLRQTEKRYCH